MTTLQSCTLGGQAQQPTPAWEPVDRVQGKPQLKISCWTNSSSHCRHLWQAGDLQRLEEQVRSRWWPIGHVRPGGRILPSTAARLWRQQSWDSQNMAGLGGGHPVVPGALLWGATTTTATTSKGRWMLWWEKKETQSWFLTFAQAEKTEKSFEKKGWAATQTRRPSTTSIEKANWISHLCTQTPDEL